VTLYNFNIRFIKLLLGTGTFSGVHFCDWFVLQLLQTCI